MNIGIILLIISNIIAIVWGIIQKKAKIRASKQVDNLNVFNKEVTEKK